MYLTDEPLETDLKTCLDCVNFSEDAPEGYCKLGDTPAVIEFANDPDAWEDGDMSRCPGFVEDN
jgi:hypothetical protein